MTKLVLPLLLSIISLISLATSIDVSNKDINWWCSKTPHPELCRTHVKPRARYSPSSVSENKFDFRKMAIDVTMEQALRAQSHNKWLGQKCRNKRERAAWADCLQLYQNTIIELNHTVDPNIKHSDVDTQTWLSTALTNLESCRNGFVELGVSDFVLPQMTGNNVSKLVSNALAINKVAAAATATAAAAEQSFKDGFPSYVTAGDRKLLQDSSPQANLVVAKDGSGNYRTINEAIEAASDMTRSGRFLIRVKAGTYNENIVIGNSLKNIMLVGEGMRYTFITGSRSVGGGYTTFNSATLAVTGEGFIARGITFRNTAGPENHQAVALRSGADKSVFYRCGFEGYQDTLYVHSQRQFYKECYIYGTVDFIFGNAAVVLQNCMIYARKPMSGQKNMVTAQGRTDPNQNTGISIHDSRIMAAVDLQPVLSQFKTYLGRPWKLYSRTVYLQNFIDTLIDPAGWFEWDGDFALDTLYYGEYKNMGPGSSTAKRVNWGGYSVITSSSEASQFTVSNFIGGGSWLPATGVPFHTGL